MNADLAVVRLLAAVACRAPESRLRALRAEVADEDRLLELAGALGLTIALDAAADALALGQTTRRRLVASSMMTALQRDAALRLLDSLHEAGAPSSRAIVIKGGAMTLLHPAEAHRASCDVDVVVPRADVTAWLEAAARAGASVKETSGYEAAHLSRDRGMVELHVALPGFAGNDAGPSWEALRARSGPLAGRPWLVPSAAASREIAVQHFLFHHGGEAGHALRTLQDLALVDADGEGDGIDWGTPAVARATEGMRAIARAIRDGDDDDREARSFLTSLALVAGEHTSRSFAEESKHWIDAQPGVAGKLALLARRLAPPLRDVRREGDSPLTVALRYARRPFDLAAKYRAAARRDRERAATLGAWRDEIERLGK